jgi:hypothetical protein
MRPAERLSAALPVALATAPDVELDPVGSVAPELVLLLSEEEEEEPVEDESEALEEADFEPLPELAAVAVPVVMMEMVEPPPVMVGWATTVALPAAAEKASMESLLCLLVSRLSYSSVFSFIILSGKEITDGARKIEKRKEDLLSLVDHTNHSFSAVIAERAVEPDRVRVGNGDGELVLGDTGGDGIVEARVEAIVMGCAWRVKGGLDNRVILRVEGELDNIANIGGDVVRAELEAAVSDIDGDGLGEGRGSEEGESGDEGGGTHLD